MAQDGRVVQHHDARARSASGARLAGHSSARARGGAHGQHRLLPGVAGAVGEGARRGASTA